MSFLPSIMMIPSADRYSLVSAGVYVRAFEEVLADYGLVIASGSLLEEVCTEVLHWEERRARRIIVDPREDIRTNARRGLSLLDLVRRIVRHRRRNLSGLVPHLRLMNETFAQNEGLVRQERVRDKNNKVFELLVALVCMDVGTDVVIDHPQRSSAGRNPDVLATIDGLRWGFACKMPLSPNPRTHFNNLEKGIEQINNSPAEVGCVVFGMKNLVDHDELWPVLNSDRFGLGDEPIFRAWRDNRPLRAMLTRGVEFRLELEAVNSTASLHELFRGRAGNRSLPAALLYFQGATSTAFAEGPVPTILNLLMLAEFFPAAVSPRYRATLEKINDALHHR